MINFLRSNYEALISCVLAAISVVIGIVSAVRAKRGKAAAYILSAIPELCSEIESLFPCGFGSVKLGFVLRQLEKLCCAYKVKFDKQYFTEQVEKVLNAPCVYD